jgi:glycosyltransferase involved in cell wall biosynthesis
MHKIKVLHFITSIDHCSGGTTTYLKLLAERISGEVDITIVTGRTSNPVKIKGVRIITLDLSILRLIGFRLKIGELLDELNPDIIHINGIWELPNTIIQNSAQKRKIPVIISPHGMLEPWILRRNPRKKNLALSLYQRQSIAKATCLHATAASEFDNIRKLGFRTDMAIIENGIKTDDIQLKESWKRTGAILFLSRVNPKKGLENLIDAIGRLKNVFKSYKIIIAGEGEPEYIETLKKRAANNQTGHQFVFCGGIYGKTKWDLYRQADVFVLPTHSENFGIVIAEALACGTPVITTTGAPWHDLTKYNCGWWIELGVEPLAESLLDFSVKTEQELEQMGRNGHRLINHKYTAEQMGTKMINLYHAVLQKN